MLTLAAIQHRGWRLKSWTRKTGAFRAGGAFNLTSLRRLLSNVLYTGSIRHKGQLYPGQHAAILPPGGWQRAQELLARDTVFPRGRARHRHMALLNGLLHCDGCAAPMVYAYAGKRDRKYPYYVCRHAQRAGWDACPSKSLPAGVLEEAVLGQIREARSAILDASEWEKLDRIGQIGKLQAMVERIGYDGRLRQISIRFHQQETAAAGPEAQA
jgi:site-specific DNA recombinase